MSNCKDCGAPLLASKELADKTCARCVFFSDAKPLPSQLDRIEQKLEQIQNTQTIHTDSFITLAEKLDRLIEQNRIQTSEGNAEESGETIGFGVYSWEDV